MPIRSPLLPLVAALAALLASPAAAQDHLRILQCGTGVHRSEAQGLVWLPRGDLFCPLVADPKAVRSFASYLYGKFPTSRESLHLGSVGLGDGFGLLRLGGPGPGEGLQVGLEAAIFAQFDLDSSSDDLLNTDFIVGIPVAYRYAGFSARARVYHQSSHLGDELLLRADSEIVRENLSFESLELILSQELGPLRVYAGGEVLFQRRPSELDQLLVHGGAELRAGPAKGARLLVAGDVKSSEQQEWKPAWSARAGVEIAWWRDAAQPPRVWSILAEYYDGPSPYGQFFLESTRYAGAGVHLQL